ncbi:hypothetical protein [Endozoicomonas sp. SESOKO3]|uniref:hypothetical protein n=2 Tax=unclassified Endozoicomonas TaxID=2644528 RepID=UPI002147A3BF|nr:hypothetical protein [Endozoicomonas sp. SESOKO3]
MANPSNAAIPANVTDPGVRVKDDRSGRHSGSVAEYSLYQCRVLIDPLRKMRSGITVEKLPEPPSPCHLLSDFKCLDRRTVLAYPSLEDSTEDMPTFLRRINAANGYGVWAELAHMDEQRRAYYHHLCQLHSQLGESLNAARQVENSLENDISLHRKNRAFEAADQPFRTLQTNKLVTQLEDQLKVSRLRSTKMQKELEEARIERKKIEAALCNTQAGKSVSVEEFQKLTQELVQARCDQNTLKKIREQNDEQSRKVKTLKEDNYEQYIELRKLNQKLLEAGRSSDKQQLDLKEMQKENDLLSRRVASLELDLEVVRRCSDAHLSLFNKMWEEKVQQSRRSSQRENELYPKTTALDDNQEQQSELELENNVLLRQLTYTQESLKAEKRMRSQVENDLQQTRSLLQEKEDEVIAWVNQSRQWNTARAAMEKEIENLMDKLSMLLQNNQSEAMEVSQDQVH